MHVFQWWPGTTRQVLNDGVEYWPKYIDILKGAPGDRYALIEFVKDDLPANFIHDAATLLSWLRTEPL